MFCFCCCCSGFFFLFITGSQQFDYDFFIFLCLEFIEFLKSLAFIIFGKSVQIIFLFPLSFPSIYIIMLEVAMELTKGIFSFWCFFCLYFLLISFYCYVLDFTNLFSPAISNLPLNPRYFFFSSWSLYFSSLEIWYGLLNVFHVSFYLFAHLEFS